MRPIETFALERYFARYEFTARHLLSSSDCESLPMASLLALADERSRRRWENLKLGYTDSQGDPALRSAVAAIYSGWQPEDVLIAAPEEAIFLLMQTLLRPDDHVVCTFPGYQSLYAVARALGCRVSFWTPEENRDWRFDIGQLERLLQGDTRLVVANFPHNPTGYLPPREDFEAMIDLLREHDIHLLSDEMYRFLEADETATLPAACTLYARAVSLGGLSKTFGLPGLRIGWTATRDRPLHTGMARFQDYATICSSAPSQILATIALHNREAIIAEQRARLRRNMAVLAQFFQTFANDFQGRCPPAGSLCFPRMTAVEDTFSFCEELVRDTGIMLVPSKMFAYGHQHVRIGFGRKDFPEVLKRFGDYLIQRFG